MSFIAMYDSTGFCPKGCGNRIRAGDRVNYDENDQLAHELCAPRPDRFEIGPHEVICPDCRLVRPCRCVE